MAKKYSAKQLEPGTRFRYVGNEPLGQGPGTLFPGTVVNVREVVPADEPGAHDDQEDAVVIEWEEEDVVVTGIKGHKSYTDEDGREREKPVFSFGKGPILRAMSVGLDGKEEFVGRRGNTIPAMSPFHELFEVVE